MCTLKFNKSEKAFHLHHKKIMKMLIHSGRKHVHKPHINRIHSLHTQNWVSSSLTINVTKEITDSGPKQTRDRWFQGHFCLSEGHKQSILSPHDQQYLILLSCKNGSLNILKTLKSPEWVLGFWLLFWDLIALSGRKRGFFSFLKQVQAIRLIS